jgi:hypothetical protein
MLRRETIVALRARHAAFRIAVEILHPRQPPPPAVQPAMPILEDGDQAIEDWQLATRERKAREKRETRNHRLVLAIVSAVLVGLYAYACYVASQAPPPPPAPPQARPIMPTQ